MYKEHVRYAECRHRLYNKVRIVRYKSVAHLSLLLPLFIVLVVVNLHFISCLQWAILVSRIYFIKI